MKTIAVLVGLATVAIAVSALPGYNFGQEYRLTPYRLPATSRREKKSPELTRDVSLDMKPVSQLDSSSEVEARTFGFKKPIIVKKKYGYHPYPTYYRDSDTETHNSIADLMRSVAEDTIVPLNEDEIKTTKEAVEKLQKFAEIHTRKSSQDIILREDIETLRDALDHIQQANKAKEASRNLKNMKSSKSEIESENIKQRKETFKSSLKGESTLALTPLVKSVPTDTDSHIAAREGEDTPLHLTEYDIKLAKELIESLQKLTEIQNIKSRQDAEQEQIQILRDALDNFQRNFSNFELRDNTGSSNQTRIDGSSIISFILSWLVSWIKENKMFGKSSENVLDAIGDKNINGIIDTTTTMLTKPPERDQYLQTTVSPSLIADQHVKTVTDVNHQVQPKSSFFKVSFKSMDEDSATAPSTKVNVNDAVSKAAVNHDNLMDWKKQKEVARGAYGAYGAAAAAAGAGGGPGAVGVFPGASVGGCAVPLLLSCSPSVVPGTLAHAPAYGAPHAYRATNELNRPIHNKRDTKATKKNINNVKRTPAKVIQNTPFEKKL